MRCPNCNSDVDTDTCERCGSKTTSDTTYATTESIVRVMPRPGRDAPSQLVIPGLTVKEQLGCGGFATVYRAGHDVLGMDVAVKVFRDPPGYARVDQTLAEARLLARLDHPNLVRTFGAGEVSAGRYVVMELMDGGSCEGMRSLSTSDIISVTHQLLSALQALHAAKILHRDIKPANCLRQAWRFTSQVG